MNPNTECIQGIGLHKMFTPLRLLLSLALLGILQTGASAEPIKAVYYRVIDRGFWQCLADDTGADPTPRVQIIKTIDSNFKDIKSQGFNAVNLGIPTSATNAQMAIAFEIALRIADAHGLKVVVAMDGISTYRWSSTFNQGAIDYIDLALDPTATYNNPIPVTTKLQSTLGIPDGPIRTGYDDPRVYAWNLGGEWNPNIGTFHDSFQLYWPHFYNKVHTNGSQVCRAQTYWTGTAPDTLVGSGTSVAYRNVKKLKQWFAPGSGIPQPDGVGLEFYGNGSYQLQNVYNDLQIKIDALQNIDPNYSGDYAIPSTNVFFSEGNSDQSNSPALGDYWRNVFKFVDDCQIQGYSIFCSDGFNTQPVGDANTLSLFTWSYQYTGTRIYDGKNTTYGITTYTGLKALGVAATDAMHHALPGGWITQDIGSVGLTGSASYTPDVFTIAGGGADIYNYADAFRYVYKLSNGNCSVVARVDSQENTNSGAKAGVMIRESTAASVNNAGIFLTPGNGVSFQWRSVTGGGSSNTTVAISGSACWVKMTRISNSFSGYYSTDGTAWTQVGTTQTIAMSPNATVGLAATAHDNSKLSTCKYSHVKATPTGAFPFVHKLFSSHMVMQRSAVVPIWGWTTPGTTVTVALTGTSVKNYTTTAEDDGFWITQLASPAAGGTGTYNGTYTIAITGTPNSVTLTDVLMGDVYLFAGEANIAGTLNSIPVLNAAAEIADSVNYPNIRGFCVPQDCERAPLENLGGGVWVAASPSTTGGFSATAYFTARELYKVQNVPIGFISAAWAGSKITSWVPSERAAGIADLTQTIYDQSQQTPGLDTVSGLNNGMVEPLSGLSMKGVVWYQGESDVSSQAQYGRLLPAMIAGWRVSIGAPTRPFVIVQSANYAPPPTGSVESGWAELREAQFNGGVLQDPQIVNKLVTTIDIGDASTMCPQDKQDVGLRAAWCLLSLSGSSITNQGPSLSGSVTISGTNITCTFSNVGGGLMVGAKTPLLPAQPLVGGTLTGFAIAGADKVFYAAKAIISGNNKVVVSSPSVSAPVAVRYGWANNPSCNLYNMIKSGTAVVDGLPAVPFRTDPVYCLSVNSGMGSGTTSTLGAQLPIAANTYEGEAFHHWSGDITCLSSTTSATGTATVSQGFVSVLANYQITGSPTNLAALAQVGKVSLTWNSMTSVHYNLKRATAPSGPYTVVASDLLGSTLSYVDSTVTEGTTYYYAISAANLLGEGPDSSAVSVTVVPTVHNLTAAAADTQVTLSWDAFAGSVDYYQIKRSTTSGGPYTTIATGSSLSFTDQSILSGVTYYYVISAVTAGVESLNCPEIAASAFRIVGIVKSGSDIVINFTTLNGKAYLIEKTATLAPSTSWSLVQDNIAGTGTVVSGTDSGATDQARMFYHVISQ